MSISRQNLSVIIVSYISGEVIHNCIKSIPKDIQIIVVDNSSDERFKFDIEKRYNNIKCILSPENLGMGAGNNLGLKHTNTDYVLILNPDVILENNTIDELINASNKIDLFGIIAPIINSDKNINFKLFDKNKINIDNSKPFLVKSVDGFAMLLNVKKINQIDKFKNFNFFDENIFLYLENDDLCLRTKKKNEKIYIINNSIIDHIGASSSNFNQNKEIEYLRNWHWMWSKFYFNKKHKGYLNAFFKIFFNLISAKIKFVYYFLTFNSHKKKIYQMRILGLLNSMLLKKSFYRLED